MGHCAIGNSSLFPLHCSTECSSEIILLFALGLEQLCKVAVANTGGLSGSINIARILVSSGRPMFNIDTRTMQVSDEVAGEYLLIVQFPPYHREKWLHYAALWSCCQVNEILKVY